MNNETMRELFIDELTEVTGGNPLERIIQELKEGWNTTQACCEEGQCCDYWS